MSLKPKKIITHKSKTGSTKQQHVLYGEPTSGTLADYMLLKEDYKSKDIDHILKDIGWQVRLFYHFNFLLKRMIDCDNNLVCVYCGQEHLVIQPVGMVVPKDIMATVDHFTAKGKGGDHFNEDNMVVSCSDCNGKKADKEYGIETLKYMDEKRLKLFTKLFVINK